MEEVHSTLALEYKTFEKPDSITSAVICTKSGELAIPGVCDHTPGGNFTKTEYFAKGTAPTKYCTAHVKVSVCEESDNLASPFCPEHLVHDVVYLIKEETSPTDDTPFLYPTDEKANVCPIHSEGTISPPIGEDDEYFPEEPFPDETEDQPGDEWEDEWIKPDEEDPVNLPE